MDLESKIALAVAVCTLIGAVVGFFKWVRPRWREFTQDGRAVRDTLLGRPAYHDTITGIEKVPALPGIGKRMDTVEQNVSVIATSVAKLAQVHDRLNSHDQRIGRLEKAEQERTLARTESIEMLRVVDTALRSDPDPKDK